MRASEAVSRLPRHVIQAFMMSLPAGIRDNVAILQNPTSELREELADAKGGGKGWRDVAMFAQNFRQRRFATVGQPAGQPRRNQSSGNARLEENYFYSTRRFPVLTTNTIGGGGLVAGTFPFFTKGVNDDGVGLGFPTGFSLTGAETNLEVGGSIPQGTSFVFNQLGITFESDIATADLAIMLDAATLAFSKAGGQFNLFHGPLKMWPGGMGIEGYAAASTTASATTINIQAAHNGKADIRAVRQLKIPRVLREKETFNYSVVIHRGTKAKDGSTIALSNFVLPTIWLFGGQRNVIPT
jgi:hypothetical protein